MADTLLQDLRHAIAARHAVLIVGTGVSIGATRGAEEASWSGLIRTGIQRCVELRRAQAPWAKRRLADLRSGDIDELLSAAEQVAFRLGAPDDGEFARWLRDTVGSLVPIHLDVLGALVALGAPLATTNYDGLIEYASGQSLKPVTWRDGRRVERVLRGDDPSVLHLHGYWEDPRSIVFGARSYQQILDDAHAQTVLKALRLMRTLVFVGFGSGLSDPNFAALLRWTRSLFAGSEYRHFRLARSTELSTLQNEHPPEERLFVIPYGTNYDDLGPFLRDLAPTTGATPAPHTGAAASTRPTPTALGSASSATPRVLVVDDDLTPVSPLLAQVQRALDGRATLELFNDPHSAIHAINQSYNVLGCLTDIVFRSQSPIAGIAVAEAALKRGIPVLIMTGHEKDNLGLAIEELSRIGIADEWILSKPTTLTQYGSFLATIREWMMGANG